MDQEGAFIAEWTQFSRPSGIDIRDGLIYVADSESNGVAPHPGWLRGIRIGSIQDGKVIYRIPDPLELKGTILRSRVRPRFSTPHGVISLRVAEVGAAVRDRAMPHCSNWRRIWNAMNCGANEGMHRGGKPLL